VEISDSKLRRTIRVEKSSSASTVVWNPWIAKSKAMTDFGDEEFHRMVCVEAGNVGQNQVTLAPGKASAVKVGLSSMSLK
jgi:D-hexose-6-phosphate mutarotase